MNTSGITTLVVLLLIVLSGFSLQTQPEGKKIFENNCTTCHGSDGTKGRFGAKNLKTSKLKDGEIISTVKKGRRIMPSWEGELTQEQIEQVVEYVKQLRS